MNTNTDTPDKTQTGARAYRRHGLTVRLLHWLTAAALLVMLLSGLQIFNADPALYWGKSSYAGKPPFFQITSRRAPDGTLEGSRTLPTSAERAARMRTTATPGMRAFDLS